MNIHMKILFKLVKHKLMIGEGGKVCRDIFRVYLTPLKEVTGMVT